MKKYVAGFVGLLPLSAMAAVPTEITDALAAAKTDAATVATSVLLIVYAIAVIKYLRAAK